MSGYTYDVNTGTNNDTSPEAPKGSGQGVGDLPSWSNPGVHPPAPSGSADHVGEFNGFPDASGLVEPKPPIVDGKMPMNKGRTTGSL